MDPENGTVTEETSQEVSQEQQTPQESSSTEVQETPAVGNSVADALNAFDAELGRGSTAAVATPQQQQPQKQAPKARSFEGLEPHEVDYFKRMSNQAYDALYPQWIEAKKLRAEHEKLQKEYEQTRNMHFYEHDGAYKLIPEYNELTQADAQIKAEISHWEEQLALIEEGKPWTPLVYDDKGNVVYGAEREPTPQDKAKVLNSLSKGHVIAGNIRDRISKFEGEFKQQHGGYLKQLSDTRARIFQGADLTKLAEAAKSKLDMFPTAVRGKPEVKMLAEGMVIIEGLIKLIDDLKSNQVTTTARNKTNMNNGPKNAANAAAVGTKTVASALEDFKKAGFGH